MKGTILEETMLTIELAQAKNRINELERDKAQLQSEFDDLVDQITELTMQRDALYRDLLYTAKKKSKQRC